MSLYYYLFALGLFLDLFISKIKTFKIFSKIFFLKVLGIYARVSNLKLFYCNYFVLSYFRGYANFKTLSLVGHFIPLIFWTTWPMSHTDGCCLVVGDMDLKIKEKIHYLEKGLHLILILPHIIKLRSILNINKTTFSKSFQSSP